MILEIRNIDTFYGLGHVLHGLSLDLAEGEVVALLGRNGAGKTTTLRSITGLTPPRLALADGRRARALPRPARTPGEQRPPPLRRRAGNARHRPRPDDRSGAVAPRRALAGPRPAGGERGDGHHTGAEEPARQHAAGRAERRDGPAARRPRLRHRPRHGGVRRLTGRSPGGSRDHRDLPGSWRLVAEQWIPAVTSRCDNRGAATPIVL